MPARFDNEHTKQSSNAKSNCGKDKVQAPRTFPPAGPFRRIRFGATRIDLLPQERWFTDLHMRPKVFQQAFVSFHDDKDIVEDDSNIFGFFFCASRVEMKHSSVYHFQPKFTRVPEINPQANPP